MDVFFVIFISASSLVEVILYQMDFAQIAGTPIFTGFQGYSPLLAGGRKMLDTYKHRVNR
ncbi:MAG: hypothetical protein CMQ19_00475 [Gammaproteobacteria bacterium]|nr:hypothetical protein [Gammaproteobacteria bacterium]